MADAPRITLEQWRALQAVVEAGGYAQAAEALHKTQSTLTYAVQKIERLLDVKVFEIRGRKAVLTEAGQVLYRRARTLVEEAALLERGAAAMSRQWQPEIGIAVEILFPTWLLIECLGEKLNIAVVSKGDTAIASIITLSFKNVVMDKYNCSNPQFNSLGGPVFLIWRSIQESLTDGLHHFDLGRSDYTSPGLIAFKEHWGAARYPVSYFRYPAPAEPHSHESRLAAAGKRFLATVPDSLFAALGGLLYRHAG